MGKDKVGDSKILVPVGKEIFKNIKFNYPGSVPEVINNSSYDIYVIE